MLRGPHRRRSWLGIVVVLVVGSAAACTSGDDAASDPMPEPDGSDTTTPESAGADAVDLVDLVDPFVGTDEAGVVDPVPGGAGGQTLPGAAVPFGAVIFGPDTPGAENDTGYAWSADTIEAFSLVHYSGAGCPNNELVRLLPTIGGDEEPVGFSHDDEEAAPGWYRVGLANGIDVETTATARTGTARITAPGAELGILLDADHRESSFDVDFDSSIEVADDHTIVGTVGTGSFCGTPTEYDLHFAATFDRPVGDATIDPDGRARLAFDTGDDPDVEVRVGLSFVSRENATANLAAEAADRPFDDLVASAHDAWAEVLDRVRVQGGTEDQRRTLATALYHAFLHPSVDSDVNGEYLGFDDEVHTVPEGTDHYGTFSGWDIYRSQVQLLAVLVPERAEDIVASMAAMAEECGGGYPMWTTGNVETSVMVGDPGAAMVANLDAFGAAPPDVDQALEVMTRSALDPTTKCGYVRLRPGLAPYAERGYAPNVPYDEAQDNLRYLRMWQRDLGDVSTNLEYAVSDAAIAAFADRHGDQDLAEELRTRAANWEEVFDPEVGYVRPRLEDGSFHEPFDPTDQYGFTEGNAAQYTWMVPHAYGALVECLGGPETTVARLDDLFTELNAGLTEPHFYIGNEPLFTAPWAYLWAGAPDRAQDVVRRVLTEEFTPTPGGLPGNDDLGAMSSWYVWAALGMFPTVPGEDVLTLTTPLFPAVTLDVPGRDPVRILAPGATDHRYVESVSVDDVPLDRAWLRWSDLVGATLEVTTSSEPTDWATGPDVAPPSIPVRTRGC